MSKMIKEMYLEIVELTINVSGSQGSLCLRITAVLAQNGDF